MSTTRFTRWVTGIFVVPAVLVGSGCSDVRAPDAGADTAGTAAPPAPYITASNPVEAGRYLVKIAGCNDCHTPGVLEGNLPDESEWLVGSPLGWRGPWGTTYAKNLRLSAAGMTEDAWVDMAHNRNALPPMPWVNLHALSDQDARAMYAYIRSLGSAGERMPDPLPPGVEPKTPFLSMEPVMPAK
ncbi:MAG: c-type cytochrome [Gemmatimonadota bacterium]